jgi:serine/threonine protein kinase
MGDRDDASVRDAESAEAALEAMDPTIVRAKARVGSILRDKWRLDALLGVGGMAAVYAATHRNGSRAAVKVLHAGMSSNPFVRPTFLWEGYLANAVEHEGAVKVIDDDEAEDGSRFLVTELLDGETLEERRVRLGGRLACDEVLLATDQVLSVLTAAHTKGVIHRDLKPENLFVTRAGEIKVLDFGVARLRQLPASNGSAEPGEMVGGTPAYMAPEQANGLADAVDERSDLWACGATMFCLLSGRTVNEGATTHEQLVNVGTRRAPSLRSAAPDVDAQVARLVHRALEFSKERRWPSASAMHQALRKVYQDLYGHPISDAPRFTFPEHVPHPTGQQEPGSVPALSRRIPTRARPLARSDGIAWRSPLRAHARGVAIGGAAALGFLLLSVALMLSGWHTEGRAQATPSPRPMSSRGPPAAPDITPQPTREVASPPPPSPPVIDPPAILVSQPPVVGVARTSAPKKPAVSALPSAALNLQAPIAQAPIAQAPIAQAPNGETFGAEVPSAQPPPAATPSVHPQCAPPYVVDATTGKRHWKLECL